MKEFSESLEYVATVTDRKFLCIINLDGLYFTQYDAFHYEFTDDVYKVNILTLDD